MIIIDENVDQHWLDFLTLHNYPIYSIRLSHPGASDREIVTIVKSKKGILLTEDKDFGELVFAFNLRDVSVVFLRYDKPDHRQIEKILLEVLEHPIADSGHYFVTITAKKARIRKI